jgi:hypothetical protein
MKQFNRVLLVMFLFNGALINAQTDTLQPLDGIELDLLTTPTNPAFILMSTSPNEIVEPSSAPEFYLSVQNASNNFSTFPNNYGFTVTPYWWTNAAKELSFEDDFSTEPTIRFWRHLRLSAGVVKGVNDNENLWRYGAGIQSTILPGKVDAKLKAKYDTALTSYHYKFIMGKEQYVRENKLYRRYDSIQLQLRNDIVNTTNEAEKDSLIKILSNVLELKTELDNELGNSYEQMVDMTKDSLNVNQAFSHMEKRIGLKMDFGAGIAGNAQNNKLDSLSIYRLGFWTNIGWTCSMFENKSYLSFIFLARFLNYADLLYITEESGGALFNNLRVLDLGVQVKFDASTRFSLSFEAVYRAGFDDRYSNTYRLNALAQYKFSKNRLLFVSFGNMLNEYNDSGPDQLVMNIGLNLGFGEDVTIKRVNIP